MQNSVVMLTVSDFGQVSFLGKFGPKNRNCQFVLKFGAYNHSQGIGGLTLVFVWDSALPEGFSFCFSGVLC